MALQRTIYVSYGLLVALTVFQFGCSSISRGRCELWKQQGQMYATMESCVACTNQFGSNVSAVSGCALGLDAGKLLSVPQPAPSETHQ